MEGVVVKPLKQFRDGRGKVMHMLKSTDDVFEKFGEIYFSVCNPGIVKAWKLHKKKTSMYCVISGSAKIVLAKDGEFMEINAGDDNYVLVKIPPGIAHGFKCTSEGGAILANLASEPYDPEDNFDIKLDEIKYTW